MLDPRCVAGDVTPPCAEVAASAVTLTTASIEMSATAVEHASVGGVSAFTA